MSTTGKIFTTVWTGGAKSTYDLSNFDTDGSLDLRPGQWLTFAQDHLADLNSKAAAGTPEFMAKGNVYNTLVVSNNLSSEISNLITGNGNNKITGNDLFNTITLGSGADTVNVGGAGAHVYMGSGADVVNAAFTSAKGALATIVDYSKLASAILADLTAGTVSKGGVSDTLSNVASLIGSNGNDTIKGGAGTTTITGGGGNDVLTAGAGVATATYLGKVSDYTIGHSGGFLTVADKVAGRDGADTLSGFAQLKFADGYKVFDLTSSEDLLVYKVYNAAYKRTPDDAGYRFWAQEADRSHLTADQLAHDFMSSAEFTSLYGANPTDQQFISELYGNVLGRTPDDGGYSYWQSVINSMSREHLLALFALSNENAQIVASNTSDGFWTV